MKRHFSNSSHHVLPLALVDLHFTRASKFIFSWISICTFHSPFCCFFCVLLHLLTSQTDKTAVRLAQISQLFSSVSHRRNAARIIFHEVGRYVFALGCANFKPNRRRRWEHLFSFIFIFDNQTIGDSLIGTNSKWTDAHCHLRPSTVQKSRWHINTVLFRSVWGVQKGTKYAPLEGGKWSKKKPTRMTLWTCTETRNLFKYYTAKQFIVTSLRVSLNFPPSVTSIRDNSRQPVQKGLQNRIHRSGTSLGQNEKQNTAQK